MEHFLAVFGCWKRSISGCLVWPMHCLLEIAQAIYIYEVVSFSSDLGNGYVGRSCAVASYVSRHF